jgi:hypothetical protein
MLNTKFESERIVILGGTSGIGLRAPRATPSTFATRRRFAISSADWAALTISLSLPVRRCRSVRSRTQTSTRPAALWTFAFGVPRGGQARRLASRPGRVDRPELRDRSNPPGAELDGRSEHLRRAGRAHSRAGRRARTDSGQRRGARRGTQRPVAGNERGGPLGDVRLALRGAASGSRGSATSQRLSFI